MNIHYLEGYPQSVLKLKFITFFKAYDVNFNESI